MSRTRLAPWTAADQAELDVLLWHLADAYQEHRERGCRACDPSPCAELAAWYAHRDECRACEGDAPLTFGPPCADWRERRLAHGRTCPKCSPCPHLQAVIAVVCDWRDARILLSHAEALRAAQERRAYG
jgi:hypothetical protein